VPSRATVPQGDLLVPLGRRRVDRAAGRQPAPRTEAPHAGLQQFDPVPHKREHKPSDNRIEQALLRHSANVIRTERDICPTRGPHDFQDGRIRVDADDLSTWANRV
jgi:hypothetical protein